MSIKGNVFLYIVKSSLMTRTNYRLCSNRNASHENEWKKACSYKYLLPDSDCIKSWNRLSWCLVASGGQEWRLTDWERAWGTLGGDDGRCSRWWWWQMGDGWCSWWWVTVMGGSDWWWEMGAVDGSGWWGWWWVMLMVIMMGDGWWVMVVMVGDGDGWGGVMMMVGDGDRWGFLLCLDRRVGYAEHCSCPCWSTFDFL